MIAVIVRNCWSTCASKLRSPESVRHVIEIEAMAMIVNNAPIIALIHAIAHDFMLNGILIP